MYDSPTSVEEAAKILDKDKPGWAYEVTQPVQMSSWKKCVLAQVYGNYLHAAYKLFGYRTFGDLFMAHNEEWQAEVDKRRK